MSSPITIPLPPWAALDDFCSTHEASPAAIVKLAFAVVLHQYFDLSDFTCFQALPQNHDRSAHFLVTSAQQVGCSQDLASTTSLGAALGLRGANSSVSNEIAPLFVESEVTAVLNGIASANGPAASLFFAQTGPVPTESLLSSLVPDQNNVSLIVFSDKASISAHLLRARSRVSEFVATGMADAFAAAMQSIISMPLETAVADLDICGVHSRATISKWNQKSTSTPNKLLHELVGQGFRHKPDAIAIRSWDGQMPYSELDERSSNLAAYMMETYDLKPGKKVALCFEKCTWAVVSMLAVLKAGAAYCCLDPNHPRARHDFIISTLDTSLILTSTLYERRLEGHHILVPTLGLVRTQRVYQPTDVEPSDTCMVAFTSGSTGNPKGIVHTHNSLVTGITYNAAPQCLDREGVSTYQWSSFTFDVSMIEIYAPLIYGGCICIPSDEERLNDVEGSMNRMAVNWAYFTPSFARVFAAYDVPSLQTLLMGGEVVTSDDINAWIDRVKVIHSYGPAESATFFLAEFDGPCPKTVPIGPAPNTYSWIVHPENPELLSPLGAIGEMLYEGPGLLKEYLGDPAKTKKALIDAPSWRKSLDVPSSKSKLYRSGDLVRYLPDGMIMYIGRKDTMVKLRGQRLEVEEVESAIRKSVGGTIQVAVDVILPSGKDQDAVLVAFLSKEDDVIATVDFSKFESDLRAQLDNSLPKFMIPRVFLPMESLPYNSSRKLDRRALRQYGSSLTLEELLQPSLAEVSEESSQSDTLLTPPTSNGHPIEARDPTDSSLTLEERSPPAINGKNSALLRDVWSRTLSIEADEIADDDDFFRYGGDSLKAMALVAIARSSGLSISVAKVFQNPTFAALVSAATSLPNNKEELIAPLSLLGSEQRSLSILLDAATQCGVQVGSEIIQDVLPATPLQAGFITGSQERIGAYMAQYSVEIPPQVSPEFFKEMWDRIIQEYSILRTRLIYSHQYGVFQVILSTKLEWHQVENHAQYLEKDRLEPMRYGRPLCRVAIVHPSGSQSPSHMILTMHHALYDRHTLDKLLSAANSLLQGRKLTPGASFAPFIKFLMNQDESAQQYYWEKQLEGPSAVKFPWLPSAKHIPKANSTFQINIQIQPSRSATITQATIFRAAWALLVSHYTGSQDVVHGLTFSGRGAPVSSILDIVGPTITTVPARGKVSREQKIIEWLRRLQKDSSEMMEFEQTGLSKIKSFNETCKDACSFNNLLVMQSSDGTSPENGLQFHEVAGDLQYFNEYALMVLLTIHSTTADVIFSFDSNVVDTEQVARYAHHLEYLVNAISAAGDGKTIGDIYPASLRDIVDLVALSGSAPEEGSKMLLHDFIEEGFSIDPHKKAIESWDGDMTFEELRAKSTQLGHKLKTIGASRGVVVAFLFEKSIWTIVSILAALKTGAAFLFLDPTHPVRRQQSVIQTSEATIALGSPMYTERLKEFQTSQILVVDGNLFDTLAPFSGTDTCCDAGPDDLSYLLTTSGTTGEPKVILHTHASISSGLRNNSRFMHVTSSTRTIQVSAYTFDLSFYEIFLTLWKGGTVCVPGDDECLNDLAACIRRYEANWAFITPSFARLLREQDIPTLRNLCLSGEALPREDEAYWAPRLQLTNVYGASEMHGFTVGELSDGSQRPGQTARAGGSTIWIIDRHTNALLPFGARGEVALGGPSLARGYAKDPAKTARAFRPAPAWLPTAYRDRRIYATGDMGQLNTNGTLTVLGRFDTQIKLNGKRIEIEDIEANIRSTLPARGEVAVDLVDWPSGEPRLVAFLTGAADEAMRTRMATIRARIRATLPPDMVPRIYIPLPALPINSNGKLDRARLREHARSLPTSELFTYTESRSNGNVPAAPHRTASLLRSPWSKVLSVAPDDITDDDGFFENGGDSLKAVALVAAARASGVSITIAQVLRCTTFGELASAAVLAPSNEQGRPV